MRNRSESFFLGFPSVFCLSLALLCGLLLPFSQVQAQSAADNAVIEASRAFNKNEGRKLKSLLSQVEGHPLEPWVQYWELRTRLWAALPSDVNAFYQRWPGTYVEDRLRNDWLLELGHRRDWGNFAKDYAQFRMQDDREVRCFAIVMESQTSKKSPEESSRLAQETRRLWWSQKEADEGCNMAAKLWYDAKLFKPLDLWRKARLASEWGRPKTARQALEPLGIGAEKAMAELYDNPSRYLEKKAKTQNPNQQELTTLALVRLSVQDEAAAAQQMDSKWSAGLNPEQRAWIWAHIAKQAAMGLRLDAANLYLKAIVPGVDVEWADETWAWKARAAMRVGRWTQVLQAIAAMSAEQQQEPAWVYWKARALQMGTSTATTSVGLSGQEKNPEAENLWRSLINKNGYYSQLAADELGKPLSPPPRPAPLTEAERAAAKDHVGLQRALKLIALGLRSEGVREWNWVTNLATPGGLPERALLAAAQLACDQQIWDRCINTSERSVQAVDMEQRFPTPYRDAVVKRSQQIGLDPAYVYGLIRQESRFVTDARSGVGAAGLMQVMPRTARWTAHKLGIPFSPALIHDRDTNIAIGTGYLKLVLDDFEGSMPLAAAAYNAGPSRSRRWREGPVLDGAIWAENIPFNETRDYVKKVLSNATWYATVLTGKPQSIKSRLGLVGPRSANISPPDLELP